MIVKAHTSIIGDTGYNCHSRNFFKSLDKIVPVKVRNFTVGSKWNGYVNDEVHDGEYYMDDQLRTMLTDQTLYTSEGKKDFPLYQKYNRNLGDEDVHIVLNETNHHYFYDEYPGKKIAYNVWETTRQPDDFFERLKEFDQVWVPTEWQRQCTIEQGIPESKVKVVPEGVDTEMYKPLNRVVSMPLNRPFKFLLIGRWDYRKSTKEIIETFIKTFSDNENVELIISVDNPFASDGLETTEKRLEYFGINKPNIKVLHHLSKEDYVSLLKSADVFLSCARSEGWNLPLIESMSCGIPSIYSNWGGQLQFASGRGIPVEIKCEVDAGHQTDEYYSWTKGAPGKFAEPNFEDLSRKMRDVFQNYTVYKKRAIDESDEIRQEFTWENAANIAKNILDDFLNETKKNEQVVSIIIARADTPKRKKLLKQCIDSIDTEIILSTNYPVDVDIQSMVDHIIFSNENPVLLKDEFEKHGVQYFKWKIDSSGNKEFTPFEYEHGYAVYLLTRKGLEYANSIDKKIIHIINYDYEISTKTLRENEEKLTYNDLCFYKHNDWDFDNDAYCSAFISGKIESLLCYFTLYNTKESYYNSMSGFNILELNLTNFYKKSSFRISEFSIEYLKLNNKVDQEHAGNMTQPYLMEKINRTFKEISDQFDCDKTTYHKYDRYYPMFLEKWRDRDINIFEIGLDRGKSMNIWENYFPFAKIWGMDISKQYSTDRCNVFIGDQSKLEDLRNVSKQVPKCKVIVDDGSHVPEHQLKSFHYLFQNMLDWGGVYIIEDTECSYWGPDKNVYGFETGYLNIIDWFTKLNHQVNSHYNSIENPLHIKSITYGSNCIIIEKKDLEDFDDKEYRFKNMLSELPSYIEDVKVPTENKIDINFVDGGFVEITGETNEKYIVKFIDKTTSKTVFETNLKNNEWARTGRKWFTNWRIEINGESGSSFVYDFDAKNKRVFIVFESSSLGDTIAWLPYVEEFRKKHECKVIVSTFQNDLFQSSYPELQFVKPGTSISNLYALYRIGCFYNDSGIDVDRHKTDFRKLKLQEYATDILGLDFEEIKPKIKSIIPIKSEKPYICIANHSTAQPKYWNNPTGWQELVDYVKLLGYDVYLLSREEDGYMGNKNPDGVIKIDNKSLEEIGSILLGSKGLVGLGSGLSWYSWALGVPTILISGFSEPYQEMSNDVYRIINDQVCTGCFARHLFDKGDWNWCPDHKGTLRQFECTKEITFDMVKQSLDKILSV